MKDKDLELDEQVTAFASQGWRVEDLSEIDSTRLYYIISPNGRIFTREQLLFSPCTICDPMDFEAICVHSKKDLLEGERATKFAELLEKTGFPR